MRGSLEIRANGINLCKLCPPLQLGRGGTCFIFAILNEYFNIFMGHSIAKSLSYFPRFFVLI